MSTTTTTTTTTINIKKFKPLHDKVLVRSSEEREMTPGGIILPDKSKEKPIEGEIVAVGPGVVDKVSGNVVALSVLAGDKVIFERYAGMYIDINGEKLIVLRESEIVGVIGG